MKILGIETSCDETAIAIIEATDDSFTVLANIISSQIATHAPFGGVVPALAAREHSENIGHVYDMALKEANIEDPRTEIDLIAITRGPGLGPALLVGLTFARTLAMQWNKPIVGVNHMDGHVHSNWLPPVAEVRNMNDKLRNFDSPTSSFDILTSPFPALNLLVSGGHTELVLMHGHTHYTKIGQTLDDAAGEAFDKVARLLGLGYPGGPVLSALALKGRSDAYALPRPLLKAKNYDFSYSGLKTAVLYLIRDITQEKRELTEQERADIAASFQEAAIDVLIQKTRKAARSHQSRALLLSGGVSANTLLRSRLLALGSELNIPVSIPDLQWTGDNAAMIAVAGYYQYEQSNPASSLTKRDREKTDSMWQSVKMDANLSLGNTQGDSA